jgi:hypothetical protein
MGESGGKAREASFCGEIKNAILLKVSLASSTRKCDKGDMAVKTGLLEVVA